jgi:hypothetical protein
LKVGLENERGKAGCAGKSILVLVIAAWLLAAAGAWAQPAALPVWQGILRNAAGAPIPGATVRLTANAAVAEAITAAAGSFRLLNLSPGQYRLSIESKGRRIDYALPIDLVASLPGASEPTVVITLSGRGELTVSILKAPAATGGEELSSQAVSELPLNKRTSARCCCWLPAP